MQSPDAIIVGAGPAGLACAMPMREAGARSRAVALAVRGPVQVLPRELLAFSIVSWAILYRHLPARLVDTINAPPLRLATG